MRKSLLFLALAIICVFSLPSVAGGQTTATSRLDVRIITDEADAVLDILAKKEANEDITDSDWQRVFTSEGYTRLKRRELSMSRPFEDSTLREFVLSPDTVRRHKAMAETLAKWKEANIDKVAARSFAYLPRNAQIRATIYPVVKPKPNNFVFEQSAIFLYLDPESSRERFENTLAHELHHIGFGSGCASREQQEEIKKLPSNIQQILTWLGAFGEGFATLAASDGPDFNAYADESEELQTNWNKDLLDFNIHRKTVEQFFIDIFEGKIKDQDINRTGFTFYGAQGRAGQWYTVGWQMSVVIEKIYGREKLIEVMCDRRKLLSTYNRAAKKYDRRNKKHLDQWSAVLAKSLAESKP